MTLSPARPLRLCTLVLKALPLASLLALTLASTNARAVDPQPARPKKIFAHYMGCYPLACRSLDTAYMRRIEAQFRPDGPSYMERVGGRWRDYPLTPQDYKPTLEEAMDLEIRRAMRMGLDGFSVDVLAGRQDALASIDAMFKVAEEKKYPFEITFCLDNPEANLQAVKHLMEKHGKSPNLARRDGKPLFLGYRSHRMAGRLHPEVPAQEWGKPENMPVYNEALSELEKIAGEPLFAQFCLNGFIPGVQDGDARPPATDPAFWHSAVGVLSQKYGGASAFFWGGPGQDAAAKAVREAGMDWGEPIWAQYQNLFWNTYRMKDGSDLIRERWDRAIANDATLIQIATWNDYTEATNVAPGQQTGYAINDLMGLMVKRWKTGQWPKLENDRIYFFYPPYPKGSKVWPFHDFASEIGGGLEVLTYLKQPGKIVMPGRGESWEAPAGLSFKKFSPKAGPVVAELYRDGKKVVTLTAREPITARPFRAQHSLVACSTEDARYWKEDFPANTAPPVAYYGDDDGDGLPNWFEMFYFGKLGDFATATAAKPDEKHNGRTNLQAYLTQSDPLKPDAAPAPGSVWDLLANPVGSTGVSTNPESGLGGVDSWSYLGSTRPSEWRLLPDASLSPQRPVTSITYSRLSRNAFAPPLDPAPAGEVSYYWKKEDADGKEWSRTVGLKPSAVERVAIQWPCPADGIYQVEMEAHRENAAGAASVGLQFVDAQEQSVWDAVLDIKNPAVQLSREFTLKKGETLRLEAENRQPSAQGYAAITRFTVQSKAAQ